MERIQEGLASVYIYPGESTKKLTVFYNPDMEEQRNLTISILNAYFPSEFITCDALAGSGVRGIRILKETKGKVVFNDVTTDAIDLIKKNLKLNKLKAEISKKDAKILLFENKCAYDYIDIDPFGSPVKYLEPTAFAIRRNGLVAVTATDTGALAGSFKEACLRRYGVNVCRTVFLKELGIRVLITAIKKSFAKYNIAFSPLVSFSNHFFRVWGTIERGKQSTDKNLKDIGFVSYCNACLNREFEPKQICSNCKKKNQIIMLSRYLTFR